MDSKQKYKVLGLMSGTSLDGVDIAYCTFQFQKRWKYTIEKAETLAYATPWLRKLKDAHRLPAEKLIELDQAYGSFLGSLCKSFIKKNQIGKVDFIASHGHTIFHQPEKGFTLQIGNGNAIHAVSGLPVIYDFRSLDVARGGQGAPLVPVGDKLLFHDFDVCLNLGGIANISMGTKGRIAFDVCYVNMGLNYLANLNGKKFDRHGALAAAGEVRTKMLDQLDRAYSKARAKRPSLGREFFETHIQPILDRNEFSLEDRLRTFTESAAKEITRAILETQKKPTVLCTGGGTFNSFLIYRLMERGGDEINLVIPENEIINFKEALVFAFLGVLRTRGETNCLKSVTGASRDSSGGVAVGF